MRKFNEIPTILLFLLFNSIAGSCQELLTLESGNTNVGNKTFPSKLVRYVPPVGALTEPSFVKISLQGVLLPTQWHGGTNLGIFKFGQVKRIAVISDADQNVNGPASALSPRLTKFFDPFPSGRVVSGAYDIYGPKYIRGDRVRVLAKVFGIRSLKSIAKRDEDAKSAINKSEDLMKSFIPFGEAVNTLLPTINGGLTNLALRLQENIPLGEVVVELPATGGEYVVPLLLSGAANPGTIDAGDLLDANLRVFSAAGTEKTDVGYVRLKVEKLGFEDGLNQMMSYHRNFSGYARVRNIVDDLNTHLDNPLTLDSEGEFRKVLSSEILTTLRLRFERREKPDSATAVVALKELIEALRSRADAFEFGFQMEPAEIRAAHRFLSEMTDLDGSRVFFPSDTYTPSNLKSYLNALNTRRPQMVYQPSINKFESRYLTGEVIRPAIEAFGNLVGTEQDFDARFKATFRRVSDRLTDNSLFPSETTALTQYLERIAPAAGVSVDQLNGWITSKTVCKTPDSQLSFGTPPEAVIKWLEYEIRTSDNASVHEVFLRAYARASSLNRADQAVVIAAIRTKLVPQPVNALDNEDDFRDWSGNRQFVRRSDGRVAQADQFAATLQSVLPLIETPFETPSVKDTIGLLIQTRRKYAANFSRDNCTALIEVITRYTDLPGNPTIDCNNIVPKYASWLSQSPLWRDTRFVLPAAPTPIVAGASEPRN